MIRLHYYPGNASMTPHILLRELAVPFELELVDRDRDAHHSEAYLQLNPNGTIPVLVDGELVLHETAAIVMHLCDTHPDAELAPALGTPERAEFYKWICWLTNTLQPTLMVWVYPERWVSEGDAAAARVVRDHAQRKISAQLDVLEAHLKKSGPYLLGPKFSALDPFALMLCRWTRNFDPALGPPARARPALGEYLQRVLQRPSVQRVFEDEQLSKPWV